MSIHKDWVLDEWDAKDLEEYTKEAVRHLREGYWTLITQAINDLRVEEARLLLETGKNYLGDVHSKLVAYLDAINKHVNTGELALEKPFPRIDSAAAGQAIHQVLGTSGDRERDQKRVDQTNGNWSIEQVFETHRNLFKLHFSYGSKRDPNTKLLRHSISICDGQYRTMIDEEHVTFQECLEALRRFLSSQAK